MKRAVFLDRDGVLNRLVQRDGRAVSPRTLDDFELEPDAPASVQRLRDAGYRTFVITNQPDVARGHLPLEELQRMHEILARHVALDDIAFCPHDDADACSCRKPRPGMILDLATRHGVALDQSFVIGDSPRDVEAGRRAGCRAIWLRRDPQPSEDPQVSPDATVSSLEEAVRYIQSFGIVKP